MLAILSRDAVLTTEYSYLYKFKIEIDFACKYTEDVLTQIVHVNTSQLVQFLKF